MLSTLSAADLQLHLLQTTHVPQSLFWMIKSYSDGLQLSFLHAVNSTPHAQIEGAWRPMSQQRTGPSLSLYMRRMLLVCKRLTSLPTTWKTVSQMFMVLLTPMPSMARLMAPFTYGEIVEEPPKAITKSNALLMPGKCGRRSAVTILREHVNVLIDQLFKVPKSLWRLHCQCTKGNEEAAPSASEKR